MSRKLISVGQAANDGTGDTLRSAGQKINDNFEQIYLKFGGNANALNSQISFNNDYISYDGTISNGFQTRIQVDEPSAINNINFPDDTGEVILNNTSQTLTNKIITEPTLLNPIIQQVIRDQNSADILKFAPVSGASNYLQIQNNISSQSPAIQAEGLAGDVSIDLIPKGNAAVEMSKAALKSQTLTVSGATAPINTSYIILDRSTDITVLLLDGTIVGELKVFTNKGAGEGIIDPQSFGNGQVVQLETNSTVTMLWDGDNWLVQSSFGARVV